MSLFVHGNLPVIEDFLSEIQSMSGLLFEAELVSHGLPRGMHWPLSRDDYETFLSLSQERL